MGNLDGDGMGKEVLVCQDAINIIFEGDLSLFIFGVLARGLSSYGCRCSQPVVNVPSITRFESHK